ncbi:hypothetical protein J7J90_04250 [Candidatus Micrarchaeota archaeon]|nr:hypothetical protein [Candidatus Micrarchaeota archaeon]
MEQMRKKALKNKIKVHGLFPKKRNEFLDKFLDYQKELESELGINIWEMLENLPENIIVKPLSVDLDFKSFYVGRCELKEKKMFISHFLHDNRYKVEFTINFSIYSVNKELFDSPFFEFLKKAKNVDTMAGITKPIIIHELMHLALDVYFLYEYGIDYLRTLSNSMNDVKMVHEAVAYVTGYHFGGKLPDDKKFKFGIINQELFDHAFKILKESGLRAVFDWGVGRIRKVLFGSSSPQE